MVSSGLLDNRYFDKLNINRLQAQEIKTDKIYPPKPSYLFSVVLKDATFYRTESGGTLTFTFDNNTETVIKFSDRPLRKTEEISLFEFISYFERTSGNDTFKEDPPNAVITHKEEQKTYIVKLVKNDIINNIVEFNLELLPGETHNLNTVTGQINMFVDALINLFTDFGNSFDVPYRTTTNTYTFVDDTTLTDIKNIYETDYNITINNIYQIYNGITIIIPIGFTLTINITIRNYGTIQNNGTIKNNGTIQNYGTIINNGTITGNGTITYYRTVSY